jgi:NAD(P)-dependent dehydrogenase (short-subunit alcohol dehydrogenase family)
MTQPVVLITGTSSGIGLATAIGAARSGYRTVATLRDLNGDGPLGDAAAQAGVEIDVRRLDVTDEPSIRACVDGVVADHGRLDALINNAGSGHVGTIEKVSLDEVRRVMEVNFFGVVATTKAAMPYLRSSKGRLITVSSVGGAVGQPFNEAYCAAKFAVEGFMESLAPVASTVGVTVAIVEPGPVTSQFVNNVGVDPAVLFAEADFSSDAAQTSEEAAEVVVSVLTAESPSLRTQTSPWAAEFVATKLGDLDGSAVLELTRGWVD